MNRIHRTRHATGIPGWGPAPGWGQPLPGWSPLVDHGPPAVRVARPIARWWWPTLAVGSFLAIVVYVTGHDHPSLSNRGLLAIALAAVVIVLLTIHRTAGPWPLARAAAEYSVVALLAVLLALAGGADQPSTSPKAKHAATATPHVKAADDHPEVLRVAAGVIRFVTRAVHAVTGAARWLADLWRQADQQTNHSNRSPSTTMPQGEAMPPPPPLH